MPKTPAATAPAGTREITITRTYDAPRATVFAMWTEAEHLARWWGPDGFTISKAESDPQPGGALVLVMDGPDGFSEMMRGTYREVVASERLVVDCSVDGPEGKILESSHTITFANHGGGTEVTVHAKASVFRSDSQPMLDGMLAGWTQSLQCLDDALTGADERQLLFQRLYPAPPADVFPLWTDAEHLAKWWGPYGFTLTTEEADLRPGGRWKFTMHGPDGTDYPNLIFVDEMTPPSRLVYTHGEPGDTEHFSHLVTFDEVAGSTALSMRLVFPDAATRDLVAAKSGAVEGGRQTLDRLAEIIART